MKLITYTHNGRTCLGALVNDGVIDLHATNPGLPTDMIDLLRGGDAAMSAAKEAARTGSATLSLEDIHLESPVLKPSKILAAGLNYRDHFLEVPEPIRIEHKLSMPTVPIIFNKQVTSVNGPYDNVIAPPESDLMDYEAELAVVIGKECRRVSEADAMKVVAGYMVLNDVTIRDWQRASPTMMMGKSWNTHCPMGPALVTADDIDDPENLNVRLSVDGQERQNFNTGDMHFNIAQQISHLSTAFTLLPGDIIATGTSAGVAVFREGQPFLKPGQRVRVEIDGLGFIENEIVAGSGESYIH